jgi:hypothetical protein
MLVFLPFGVFGRSERHVGTTTCIAITNNYAHMKSFKCNDRTLAHIINRN